LGVGNLFFLTLHALGVKLQFDSQILIGKFCPEGRNFDYNQLLLEGKMIMEMKKQARVPFNFENKALFFWNDRTIRNFPNSKEVLIQRLPLVF
jgi:hypothetical protein